MLQRAIKSITNFYLISQTSTGIVGSLHRRDVDIGIASVTITVPRFTGLDFMIPIDFETSAFYVKAASGESSGGVTWKTYTAPFHASLWAGMLIFALVTAAALVCAGRYQGQKSFENFRDISWSYCKVSCDRKKVTEKVNQES